MDYDDLCKHFLLQCTNLQHFYCCDLADLDGFDLVMNLSNLKSIHFDRASVSGSLDNSEFVFARLLSEKRRSNRRLAIYFHNLQVDDELPDGLTNRWSKLGEDLDCSDLVVNSR